MRTYAIKFRNYSRLPIFRIDTYSNFPLIRSVYHSPWIFLNKLMQNSISYSNLQLFKILYIRSDFLFPLTKNPSVIPSFFENSDWHCLTTQNRNSDFIYSKKAIFTVYKPVLVIYSSSYNSQWILVGKRFSSHC